LAEENKVLRRRNQKTGDELLLSNTLKDVDEFFEKERQFLVEYHSNLKDCTIKADRYTMLKAVFTLAKVSAIMLMTVIIVLALATFGSANAIRNYPISVTPPKVDKASTVACRCRRRFRLQTLPCK
jgi:hypothetical protein